MADYFALLSSYLQIPLWLIILVVIWEAIWTAIAMWKSARNNHLAWFIVFFLVNLLAIPEIIYIFLFSKSYSSKRKR